MARRGENIHKRKDGRWEGRYIKARTAEGKIQWGYVYGTVYAEVKRVLIQKKAEAGFYNLKRTDLTFEALAEVWLRSQRNSIKESTYAHYSYTLHKYLLPVLSKVPVASLEESFLEQAMQQIIAPIDAAHKPLGNSSARECLSMLRRICKYAAHLRLIRPMELEVEQIVAISVALHLPPPVSGDLLRMCKITLDFNDQENTVYQMILTEYYKEGIEQVNVCLAACGCAPLKTAC